MPAEIERGKPLIVENKAKLSRHRFQTAACRSCHVQNGRATNRMAERAAGIRFTRSRNAGSIASRFVHALDPQHAPERRPPGHYLESAVSFVVQQKPGLRRFADFRFLISPLSLDK